MIWGGFCTWWSLAWLWPSSRLPQMWPMSVDNSLDEDDDVYEKKQALIVTTMLIAHLQLQPCGILKTSGGKSGSVLPWRIKFFKDSTRLIFFVSAIWEASSWWIKTWSRFLSTTIIKILDITCMRILWWSCSTSRPASCSTFYKRTR